MESTNTWLLQIYRLSDATAQAITAGVLAGIDSLAVEAASDGSTHYVVIEATDSLQAAAVRNLITSIDPGAMLAHTHSPAAGAPTAA
ncbi:MAG: hypothetical protein ACJ71Z_06935 [Aeromicrobium sp.]